MKKDNWFKLDIDKNKFYFILIILVLFISFQLAGINDKLDMLVNLK